MGYMHIDNLYKNQDVLLFKEVYAMEKIHGTSAHISWVDGHLSFFSGGVKPISFVALFDHKALIKAFTKLGYQEITIYGEAYGGKCQGMSKTYGDQLRFVAFDVKVVDSWLTVPNAKSITMHLGLDFVPHIKCKTDIELLNAARDALSIQAQKCGINKPRKREGIVIRPLLEVTKNNGKRIMAKHKNDDFIETKTPRVLDESKLVVLKEADAIANEWVTEMRLTHVLDKFSDVDISQAGDIIKAMIDDVERESEGEIIKSREARKAIGKKTIIMLKDRLNKKCG